MTFKQLKSILRESTEEEFSAILKQAYPRLSKDAALAVTKLYASEGWYPDDVEELKSDLPDIVSSRATPVMKKTIMAAVKKAEAKKKAAAQTSKISSPSKPVKITPVSSGNIDEEIIAAIAIACHMYQNGIDNTIHDVESNVLTFNQDILHNSPWGSKGLMQKQDPAIK